MKPVTELPPPPPRPIDGHKGTFGRVLLVAGSRGMSGAACLCGTSALRSGSGLVSVAVPQNILPIVASFEPACLTVPLADDEAGRVDASALESILQQARGMDAVALGPGLGQSTGLHLLVSELYRTLEAPLVVDADGLNLLAGRWPTRTKQAGPRVLTPHPGEFARLTGLSMAAIQQDRQSHAASFAAQHRVTLVLKGPGSIITDGQQLAINTTGNPGMATGGTGDVLTGIITSLLGQGMSPFEAAQLGVFVHGAAGDLAAARFGERSMIASDLLSTLATAWPDSSPAD